MAGQPNTLTEHFAVLARDKRWQDVAEYFAALVEKAHAEGRYRLELRYLVGELVSAERAGDAARVRKCRYNLALRHRLLRSWWGAELYSRLTLATPLTNETALWHVRALRELSALNNLHAPAVAEPYAREALTICAAYRGKVQGLAAAEAEACLELSAALRLQGRFGQATEVLVVARERAAGTDDHILSGMIDLRLGATHLARGQAEEAWASFADAEEWFSGVSPRNATYALIRQVSCLYQLGEDNDAVSVAENAVRAAEDLHDPHVLAQALLELGRALRGARRYEAAIPLFARVRALYADDATLEVGRAWLEEARAVRATGGALSDLRPMLAHAITLACDREDLNLLAQGLTEALAPEDESPVMERIRPTVARWAVAAVELIRTDLQPIADRSSVQRQQQATYSAGLLVESLQGDPERATATMELGRADAIGHLLARHDGQCRPDQDLFNVPRIQPAQQLSDALRVWSTQFAEFLAGRRNDPPDSPAPPDSAPLRPASGALMASFQLVEPATVVTAWCVEGAAWRIEAHDVPQQCAALLDALVTGQCPPERGVREGTWRALAQVLLPPPVFDRTAHSSVRTVILSPDVRLWNIPYPALPVAAGHLVDGVDLVLTPSLQCHQLLADTPPNIPMSSAVGILDNTLIDAAVEVDALRTWPGGHCHLTNLEEDRLDDAALLYVSGHGNRAGARNLLDGRLSLPALARQTLPPLVLLGGCWSATAMSRYGEDPFSLAVGALIGGARTVIAGTGRVGDAATARILGRLLRLLATGVPAATALRAAQLATRDAHPELGPFEWGGLLAIGAGDTAVRADAAGDPGFAPPT